jgi:SAM-dependent methyltransferase
MSRDAAVWQSPEITWAWLKGVRGAFPYGADHLALMCQLLQTGRPLRRFLDLGCGDGILAATIRHYWPDAEAVLIDFSDPMLEAARARFGEGTTVLKRDFAASNWTEGLGSFDAVVSGFAIHHQRDDGKQRIYRDVLSLLAPGGWFINLEHVASASPLGTRLWEQQMVDALYRHRHPQDATITREHVSQEFISRQEREADILAPVWNQCEWLRTIGFIDVDCFFKSFELAVFGGRTPAGA